MLALIAAGHFFFGISGGVSGTSADGQVQGRETHAGPSFGLDLSLEGRGLILLASALYASQGGISESGLLSLRAGHVFEGAKVAPLLATGLGYLSQIVRTHEDCVGGGCDTYNGAGLAAVLEAGAILGPHNTWGRATLAGQIALPIGVRVTSGGPTRHDAVPFGLLLLRLQL